MTFSTFFIIHDILCIFYHTKDVNFLRSQCFAETPKDIFGVITSSTCYLYPISEEIGFSLDLIKPESWEQNPNIEDEDKPK